MIQANALPLRNITSRIQENISHIIHYKALLTNKIKANVSG